VSNLDDLIATAHKLRAPGGCPWDAEQSHDSLLTYLIEETYELIDAVQSKDPKAIKEELGDVLYNVLFHADIAEANGQFNIQDVAKYMEDKMKSRHPHVFGNEEEMKEFAAETGEDVMKSWENHKKKEKPERESVLDGVPTAMPSLALANKVIGKAEKLGVLEKGQSPIKVETEDELGALLLAIVSAARVHDIDPELALRKATTDLMSDIRKFEVLEASDAGVIGIDSK
jgi:XTP/dITP diphosphohydrolase